MKKSFVTEKYIYRLFKPKPWKLFIVNYQEMNVSKRIRFILSSITGDFIYYMIDLNNNYLAYCLLEKKNWRYQFLKKNDYVVSPYVVNPNYRGKGLGTQLLLDIKKEFNRTNNGNLYAMVKKENMASRRAMQKAEAIVVGYAEIKGFTRKYIKVVSANPEYIIYKL